MCEIWIKAASLYKKQRGGIQRKTYRYVSAQRILDLIVLNVTVLDQTGHISMEAQLQPMTEIFSYVFVSAKQPDRIPSNTQLKHNHR